MNQTNLPDAAAMAALTEDLCRFASGVVAPDNAAYFDRLRRELPFALSRYPSGSTFNGWVVPPRWTVRRALVRYDGRTVFDAAAHPLGVALLSKPFHGEMELAELARRVVTDPARPGAFLFHCMWQYRPWDADWALSIPHAVFRGFAPGRYEVDLDTAEEPGEMLVASYEHKGRSDKTFVFNAHTCHPGMANDDNAGVALLVRLMQSLIGRDTYYSYRLVLGPEHLGTVFHLRGLPPSEIGRLVGGIFLDMPATAFPLKVASSFTGGRLVDRAVRHAARRLEPGTVFVGWRRGAGNDETVWEAPGYEVPFVEVSRCRDQFDPYPEYHSSLDTAASLDLAALGRSYAVLRDCIDILEHETTATRRFNGLICLSNPAYDLYMERPDPSVDKALPEDAEKWGHLLDCLFRYLDGKTTILDIAERHDLPFMAVHRYLKRFEQKGLVRLVRRPEERDMPEFVDQPAPGAEEERP